MQLNGLNVSILCGNPPGEMEEHPYMPKRVAYGNPVKDVNAE